MTDPNLAGHARRSSGATGGGLVASFVTLLCCAGVAPVIGALSAVGLGFLVTDAVLIPLLIVALGVTLWGLGQGRRCHGRHAPLAVGAVGSVAAVGGVFFWIPLAFAGVAAALAAGLWNAVAVRACTVAPKASMAVSETEG